MCTHTEVQCAKGILFQLSGTFTIEQMELVVVVDKKRVHRNNSCVWVK